MTISKSDLKGFEKTYKPDYEGLLRNLKREETPSRAYFMELFLDADIQDEANKFFDICPDLNKNDPDYDLKRYIAIQRYLGYDYAIIRVNGMVMPTHKNVTTDTATDGKKDRAWMEEGTGPIASWEDFEKYPWPDPKKFYTENAEKINKLLPDDMCLVGFGAHFCEYLVWLFGYQNLCYQLYDNRPLVEAVSAKIKEIETAAWKLLLQFERVKIMWHSDDLGFKTGLMISPQDMRELVLPNHKMLVHMTHDAGRISILHACGKKTDIMQDIIEDVKFDGIHSFEDTIELVTDAKQEHGKAITLIGGIDVSFLCLEKEAAIRKRVKETLALCQPGGGYALGTGNSVANYIPFENYAIMLDAGRLYS